MIEQRNNSFHNEILKADIRDPAPGLRSHRKTFSERAWKEAALITDFILDLSQTQDFNFQLVVKLLLMHIQM